MDEYSMGWSRAWDHQIDRGNFSIVRITEKHKHSYVGLSPSGEELNCYLPGKLLHAAESPADLPAVGDWCTTGEKYLDKRNEIAASICDLLPRRTTIYRMGSGAEGELQILAANVDIVFIVTSANLDFNINRLRRYILLAEQGDTQPIILLSKFDLAGENYGRFFTELEQIFPHVPNFAVSTVTGMGIDKIKEHLTTGRTAVFVGSSGVGKSTLVNALLGEELQKTKEILRRDQRGQHTTSGGSLFFVPDGGIIIDTAGLREVGIVGEEAALQSVTPAAADIVTKCRFTDCLHHNEPGCAVRQALEDGTLEQSEYDSYLKLERELAYARRKTDVRAILEEKKRWKKITKANRRLWKGPHFTV